MGQVRDCCQSSPVYGFAFGKPCCKETKIRATIQCSAPAARCASSSPFSNFASHSYHQHLNYKSRAQPFQDIIVNDMKDVSCKSTFLSAGCARGGYRETQKEPASNHLRPYPACPHHKRNTHLQASSITSQTSICTSFHALS
jgi:hypothetical protein